MKKRRVLVNILSFASILLLGGCAAVTGHGESMGNFNKALIDNKCEFKEIDEKVKNEDTILWGINGGALARNCKDYKKSIEFFDKAEMKYKEEVDKDSTLKNISESSASVLVNNNINDYEGNTYEKIMVNTYKALNFASLNDHKNARIEFNRALDRQRRAKEFFEKEIKEKKKELAEKSKKEQTQQEQKQKQNSKTTPTTIDTKKVAANKNTQSVIYKEYDDVLSGFESYPDFVNPFTTYVSGVYFLLNGDSRKARELFKESLRMDPKNKQIRNDYNLSKKYSRGIKKSKAKYVWVIYENGQGMIKDEIRIDIPLFLVTKKAHYTGIALPKIKERDSSYNYLMINNKKTTEICNMDNVIKTEFKKRFPLIVSEAVLNTVFKTWAQYQLQQRGGLVGGLLGAAYQGLTNKADVRAWMALPKSFQSTRIQVTGKPIEIKDDKGNILKKIDIPKNKNALIYVKSEVHGSNKIHEVLF